ncbi:site-specific integrase [Streptomyces abikoensis]|uniref:site-specific integrase n=1 Tax=Streptomyces abikoensis TaxID=97398 RepID=UPI001676B780|nr:site-specific integrase [Streptomyces abikoensis]GGP55474.1 site-specific integrase [Streptomyces abikoensis]
MASQRKRNPNGAGTITKRKDGRYQAAVYVLQPDGTRARKFAYGKTWAECDAKRRELLNKVDNGVPVPTRSAKLSEWLPYWLDNIIKPHRKPTTYSKYEMHVRLYLVPRLGKKTLEKLSARDVRRALKEITAAATAATARESHRVLRSALSAACREELITRNVVKLVEAPKVSPYEGRVWTLGQTADFILTARRDPLYAAFMLAIGLGLRRGELVGLRWQDIDFESRTLQVLKQRQRVMGENYEDDTKNRRKRTLPLPLLCVAPLRWQRLRQEAMRVKAGSSWHETDLVFTTRTGRPIEGSNVLRSFYRLTDRAGLPRIRVHDARHGAATLLAVGNVHPRVAMEILGHSKISVTMDVYTHVPDELKRDAIAHMDRMLGRRPR